MAEPRFYFSLRSPYSWLAFRELSTRYSDVAERLEWLPFWEPDRDTDALLVERGGRFPYVEMSRAKHLYVLQDVARLARERGIALRWPVDRAPVWEVPHLAYLVARRHGVGPQYLAAAYRARWERGHDICDRATIRAIGAEIGIDGDELAATADDPALRREGADVLLRGCRDGVFGVPFFIQGRGRFWGLDRLAAFADHLGAAPVPDWATTTVGADLGADSDHAGGCG
ncbi:2-hydroxychromene-2-carboxylate isomerase [Phytohabitans aurantiacus]|jgi:2-hydroxychromene-2-carboxylate isomerase|uniref:2-hydroxychromene-2-carboxylate isomerase n=1 Tax=Phytohabitans aurantiacus TaxID=3016789 RepID=A0ABQ5QZ08_9ACTN|nr:DsbA family protein [Phytohabitans aurantiacus]GLH99277.1 2-hydroxychromene-2-carboxylate isomerase [Phytohabitans aurantiacus]